MPRFPRHAPIPGTGLPPRGLFVSRWRALLACPGLEDLARFDAGSFAPNVLPLLFRASQQGWNVYVVGNEPGVALGRVAEERWCAFERDLAAALCGQGIRVQRHYACLEDPQGKGKRCNDSVFQFPNTGVLYHAAQEDGIELRESWVLSADALELAAAWRAGVRTLALGWARRSQEAALVVEPDLHQPDLAHGLQQVLALDPLARI